MIDRAEVEAAQIAVHELVGADGGDLVLTEVGIDSIGLRLVLESAECAECLMPR